MDKSLIDLPSGPTTLAVIDSSMPTVKVVPTVSGTDLSVEVFVSANGPIADAAEVITLTLTDGPASFTSQEKMVTLPVGRDVGGSSEMALFAGLDPGSYTLMAKATPGNININIIFDGGTVVTILPLVTVTAALDPDDMDNVIVTATVTKGPIGDEAVPLTITLRDSSNTTIGEKTPTLTSGSVTSSEVSVEFTDVPSGDITIGVSADVDKVRIIDSVIITVLPKVTLTLTSDTYLTATATAEITDGTLADPVTITAIITGPGGSATETLPALSGNDGDVVAVEFTGLASGDWTLDSASIATPDGILLDISSTAATVAGLPMLELDAPSSVMLGVAAEVVVRTSALPTGPVTVTITATRDDGVGTPITKTAPLNRGNSFSKAVAFPTQDGTDPLREGIYNFSVSVADPTERGLVTVPSGTLATLTVTNPAKPEVTVTPRISGNSLSVAVKVTNDRPLTGTETITLALSDGPSTPSAQDVTLPSGYKRGDAARTASFTSLMPGSYTLTATAAPGNINKIVYAGSTQTVTILPLVTISSAVDRDVVTVTATVSEGPIGSISLTISLLDSSSTLIAGQKKTLTLAGGFRGAMQEMFTDVPSGDITIGVSADVGKVRISNVGASVTISPKVELTLAAGSTAETATVTARIIDGTIASRDAVRITAAIDGPSSAMAMMSLPALSGNTNERVMVDFRGLAPGVWTLNSASIATPMGIILKISDTPAIVAALPVVTISAAVDRDVVMVTATVTEGPIGDDDVELAIELRDSSDTIVKGPVTRTLTKGTSGSVSADFSDVPSGAITIRVSDDVDKVRIIDSVSITVLPKVTLTLASIGGGATATATAEITDGTISSTNAVDITAHIVGPSSANKVISGLSSSSSGGMETAIFTGLAPGVWTLDSSEIGRTAPSGIILNIESATTATILPLVTITGALDPSDTDNLVVTATVTEGPIGASAVPITVSVASGGVSNSATIPLAANAVEDATETHTFVDLPPGDHTLAATVAGTSVRLAPIADPDFSVRIKPTIIVTPTVIDNDLSVAVAVTDRTLAANEVITLALSASPTMKPDQVVTLNATTTTDTVPFDDLAPGSYTLTATASPGNIKPIVYAGSGQTVTILPLVTITTTAPDDTDNLVVTATVTEGPIGAANVNIVLSVGGTPADQSITIPATTAERQTRTLSFADLPPGDYTLTATVAATSVGKARLAAIATPTFTVLPTIVLTPKAPEVNIVTNEEAVVTVSTTGTPAGSVTVKVTATHSDGSGTLAMQMATLYSGNSFSTDVTFTTGTGNNLPTVGTYNLTTSVADATEAGRVIVPSGTLAAIMVHDPTQPTVTITPTVTDTDLSVAVAVTDRTLGAAEVITLALSAGPTLKPDQMVTLSASTATGTVPFDDLDPGSYTLTATAAPGNINEIVYDGGTQVTILPLVTISSAVERDVVTVTATVTEGPIGDEDVELTITLRDSSNTTIGMAEKRTLTKGTSGPVSAEFSGVPSGALTIGVSAEVGKVRLTNSGASVTVAPKVTLTLASSDGGATATATAEITDGTLSSPVDITAHIMGPSGATAEEVIRGLSSSSSGGVETAIFTGLAPGVWTLDSSEIRGTAPPGDTSDYRICHHGDDPASGNRDGCIGP